MLPEVLSEDPIHRIPWHGQATIGANGRLIVEDHVLSAHLFGLSPLLSLAEKILVRLVAFPPAAMSIPFLAPPLRLMHNVLPCVLILVPKPVHTQI